MTYRTRYQRGNAICTLLRDLRLRSTNPVILEVCTVAITLLSAPPHERAAVDARAAELVAAAEARLERLAR